MPRYIDADALMKRLNRKDAGPHDRKYTEGFNDALMRFRSMVHSAPTVSPDEVRERGFNKRAEYPSLFTCSVCDFDCDDTYYCSTHNFKYCPNCGAKMEVSEDA